MTNDSKRDTCIIKRRSGEADNPFNEPQRRPEDGALHENYNMVGAREHPRRACGGIPRGARFRMREYGRNAAICSGGVKRS